MLRWITEGLVLAGLLSGCWSSGRPLPTVAGPEDRALLEGTSGTLVAVDRLEPHKLQIVSLPGLERRDLALLGAPMVVSGPDSEGRVAYLERDDDPRKPCYRLRFLSLRTRGETQVLKRSGSLNPSSAIALSPSGGLLAFTSSTDRGGYDYSPWTLEVIDLATGQCHSIEGAIKQHHPLWFPDSTHLVFVEWRASDRTLVTSIVDVRSGERRVLREGQEGAMPRAMSADGRSVLFGDAEHLIRVDATTGRVLAEPVELMGSLFRNADPTNSWALVGVLSEGKALYEALPTAGEEQQLVSGYSSGAKWTVKLCDPRTGAFVTVLPHVWGDVAYGAFAF